MVAAILWKTVTSNFDVQSYIANSGSTWKHTVEYAPWKGGFYERLVGIVKRSLRKSLGVKKLNREEFITILIETEAIINSRHLLYVGDDINSRETITPAHFTTPNYKTGFPEWHDNIEFKESSAEKLLSRWKKAQSSSDPVFILCGYKFICIVFLVKGVKIIKIYRVLII